MQIHVNKYLLINRLIELNFLQFLAYSVLGGLISSALRIECCFSDSLLGNCFISMSYIS